jgi:hypothetical protein
MAPVRYAPRPSCAWFSPRLAQIVPMVGKEILSAGTTSRPPGNLASGLMSGRSRNSPARLARACLLQSAPGRWVKSVVPTTPILYGRPRRTHVQVESAARSARIFRVDVQVRVKAHCRHAPGGPASEGRSAQPRLFGRKAPVDEVQSLQDIENRDLLHTPGTTRANPRSVH